MKTYVCIYMYFLNIYTHIIGPGHNEKNSTGNEYRFQLSHKPIYCWLKKTISKS